jgi:hypothetical protein
VADGSAILEVKSTTKEFLPPRMNKDQRDAITAAVAGLQIWCTDCGPTAAMYFTMEVSGLLEELNYSNEALQLQITLKNRNHNRAGSYH